MLSAVFASFLGGWLSAEPDAPLVQPKALALCAAEEWYKKSPQAETIFEGDIKRNPGLGGLGAALRFNTYCLVWTDPYGKTWKRELYLPGKEQCLAAHLGNRVRFVGKAVDTKLHDATYLEIWPARLEILVDLCPDRLVDVRARCPWQPESARHNGRSTCVVRDGLELAHKCGYFGDAIDRKATKDLAGLLGISTIDWKSEMLVNVAGGLCLDGERLRIRRVAVKDKVLVVSYRLERVKESVGGLSYPAETVVVPRFEGEVRFQEEGTSAK